MAIKLFQLIEMREKHCEMKIPQGVNSEEIYLYMNYFQSLNKCFTRFSVANDLATSF